MEKREAGVIWKERMYFRSADLFAKENLLYILWGSVYLVDKPYEVSRNYMDAYMVQYILEGELHFELRGREFSAKANELVILNCKESNHYWADKPAKVKWFHFNGKMAENIVEYIYKNNGSGHFSGTYAKKAEPFINNVFELLRDKNSSDFELSHNIYSILCELAAPPPLKVSPAEDIIKKAEKYMRENYARPIAVKDVAEYTGLSLFYFTRLFKKLMRISPHLYLTNLRLDNAKNLLTRTYHSVEEIAGKSGFQSSSHFIRAFKKSTSLTPNNFRKYFSDNGKY